MLQAMTPPLLWPGSSMLDAFVLLLELRTSLKRLRSSARLLATMNLIRTLRSPHKCHMSGCDVVMAQKAGLRRHLLMQPHKLPQP